VPIEARRVGHDAQRVVENAQACFGVFDDDRLAARVHDGKVHWSGLVVELGYGDRDDRDLGQRGAYLLDRRVLRQHEGGELHAG